MSRSTGFFHGSWTEFPVGFVLDGAFRREKLPNIENDVIEKLLAKFAPSSAVSRLDAVFMVHKPEAAEVAGGGGTGPWLYEVEPLGRVSGPYDGAWWGEIARESSWSQAYDLRRTTKFIKMAMSYWDGKRCVGSGCSGAFEFLAQKALVVRIVRAPTDSRRGSAEALGNATVDGVRVTVTHASLKLSQLSRPNRLEVQRLVDFGRSSLTPLTANNLRYQPIVRFVNKDYGYVIVDGFHRFSAMEETSPDEAHPVLVVHGDGNWWDRIDENSVIGQSDQLDAIYDASNPSAGAQEAPRTIYPTYEIRGVLAGAYKGKDIGDRALLTHAVGVDAAGRDAPTSLCGRIESDRLADAYGTDQALPPTCPLCADRLVRIRSAASSCG